MMFIECVEHCEYGKPTQNSTTKNKTAQRITKKKTQQKSTPAEPTKLKTGGYRWAKPNESRDRRNGRAIWWL